MKSFLKNVFFKVKLLIKDSVILNNSLAYFIFIILIILKKFGINIYVANIQAARIGHLLTNIDQSIYYLDQKEKTYKLLIALEGKISNKHAVSVWKKNKKILFFNFFFSRVVQYVLLNKILEKFVLNWEIIQSPFTRLYSSKKNFFIEENDIYLSNDEKETLKKEFICLHNRDPKYTREIAPDLNYFDYKNFLFDSFNLTISEIKKNNQIPIRIGNVVEKEDENKIEGYLDMSGEKSKDYMDILLQYYSKFTIVGLSGISGISTTFRKPLLYVNFTPININQLSWVSQNSIIIPKLFFSRKENRILKFKEIFNINFDIHQQENFLDKNGLDVLNNTEQEILEAYKEMNNFIDNGSHNEQNYELNKTFFSLFSDKEKSDFILNKNKLRISSFFLKKYSHLI